MFSRWSQWGKFSSFLRVTIEFNTTLTHGIKKNTHAKAKSHQLCPLPTEGSKLLLV